MHMKIPSAKWRPSCPGWEARWVKLVATVWHWVYFDILGHRHHWLKCSGTYASNMMMSWRENAFRATGPLPEDPKVADGLPSQMASNASFDICLDVKQTVELSGIWHAMALLWRHCNARILYCDNLYIIYYIFVYPYGTVTVTIFFSFI